MSETLTTRSSAVPSPEASPEPLDRVARRGLVPTGRQSDLGIEAVDEAPPEAEPEPRLPLRQRLAGSINGFDLRKLEGPKTPAVVITIVMMVASADGAAIGLLLPEIRNEFGISVGFLIAIGSLVQVLALIMALPIGYLADRVSRVWMLRIGTIGSLATVIWQALAPTTTQLAASRAATGVATSVKGPVSMTLLADYYPATSRGRAYALFSAGQYLGPIIGVVAAGLLAVNYGWRIAILTIAAIALVAGFATFLLREPVRGEVDRLAAGMDEELAAEAPPPVSFAQSMRTAWSVRTLRVTLVGTAFSYVIIMIQGTVGQLYFAEYYQLGPGARAALQVVSFTAVLAGLAMSGPVIDRFAARNPSRILAALGVLSLFSAGFLLLLAFTPPLLVVMPVGVIIGALAGALSPMSMVLSTMTLPARVRGLGLQLQAPFILLGVFIMQIAAGVFGDNLRLAWVVAAVMSVIVAAIQFIGVPGVERDVRAAQAANTAEQDSRAAREAGRSKMLVMRGVDVMYGSVQVLFGIDLDVEEGEILALLGTNGAGKSTVLRAICGLQPAHTGAVFLDGFDITYAPPHENAARGVVMMPGGQAVFPALTVAGNLRAAAHLHRDDPDHVAEQTERVLEMFPVLRERLDQLAGSLSGGEQQQLALGQAFLMKPRLLMIDELSLGLAPAIVERLLDTLREIHAAGTTIILVEQSVNVALTVADRAVFMDKGAIEFDGPTEDLLRRPDLLRSVFMGAGTGAGGTAGARRRRSARDDEAETVLQVEGIGVSFGGIKALRDVTLEVAAGEVVGIIGPNGAGKTTLFDCISGFVTPDVGVITVAGADVSDARPDVRARLGLSRSFQNARLFPSLTVREAITAAFEKKAVRSAALAAAWAPAVRRNERKLDRFVDDLIDRLGLQAYADKFIGELSTGTRRAVDVACILALDPKILLLDEPTSGLAQAETEALGPLIRQIVRESGCGVLVIEHDIPLVTSVSDRLYAMELGQVIAGGTPDEVVSNPRVLASYLSASNDVISRSDSRTSAIASALGQPVAGDDQPSTL